MLIGRKFGRYLVLGGVGLLYACAAQVPTPKPGTIGLLSNPERGIVGLAPAKYPLQDQVAALPEHPIPIPGAGEANALDISVTPSLEAAYHAYFTGEGDEALTALAQAAREVDASPIAKYHLAAQRIRTLIMMGRAAEAETESAALADLEVSAVGFDLNAVAFRAEARLWLADYQGARADAARVAKALQGWVLPTSYGGPPTNMAELILLTTAQLRAYTVLAGAAVLDGKAKEALPWAEAAERGFNAVHQVGNHGIYGLFLRPYPDSYYGRAFNLLFLGAAQAEAAGNPDAGEPALDRARAFFDAIGYRAGSVSEAAIRAWMLAQIPDRRAEAIEQAGLAVQAATDAGLADFIWRIETLRGEMLLEDGRAEEAEASFRRADAAVDLVSGALSTDRAKLRYGVGKDTIGRRLASFNLARGDLSQLFEDLERSRARAFVDMLAGRPVAPKREAALVRQIEKTNEKIRAFRVRMLSPRGVTEADRTAVTELVTARQDALAQLANRDPELAAVHEASNVTLADATQALGPEDRLIYSLPISASDPVRFLISDAGGNRVHEAALDGQELRRLIVGFRDAVDTGNAASQVRLAERLAKGLDIEPLVAPGTTYVVPSGDLFFLPWGALPVEGRFVTLPTGGWLLREGVQHQTHVSAGIVGDPAFGGALPQLDGARHEAVAVASLLNAEPMIAGEATRAALKDRLRQGGSLLHIASHGLFNAEKPLASAIALSDGVKADMLTAAEIFGDPLAADLVVLSACETGMGRSVAGDDFLGLARSFYLGGARSVMNSLWPVDDSGTLTFMTAFHKAALEGDYAGAWLAARKVTQEAGYPPSVYGAFVLGGAARR